MTEAKRRALDACPLCGGEPELYVGGIIKDSQWFFKGFIECRCCAARSVTLATDAYPVDNRPAAPLRDSLRNDLVDALVRQWKEKTKMKKLELKPCPFCGREAEMQTSTDSCPFPSALQGHVYCLGCGVRGPSNLVEQPFDRFDEFERALSSFKQDLADGWNKRANPTKPQVYDSFPERCGTCRYFDGTQFLDEGAGGCVINPPVVVSKRRRGVFPRVNTGDRCGKWEPVRFGPKGE